MNPNSIFDDQSLRGGIPVSSADIIKLFCDIDRVKKISRSTIKLEVGTFVYYYRITEDEMALRFNGTAVRVRGISTQLNELYLFDLKTDAFIGRVKKVIPAFGDKASMDSEPNNRSLNEIKRLGATKKRLKQKAENQLKVVKEYAPPVTKKGFNVVRD